MKRISLILLCLYAINAIAYSGRTIQSFNDGWYYSEIDETDLSKVSKPEVEWQSVHLPHTWNLDAYSTRNYRRASSWYMKDFYVDGSHLGDTRYVLRFDAVNSLAEVYVNDELTYTHKGGYTAFNVDITDRIKANCPNRLMVHVNNRNRDIPPLSGDFTIFGGIYRNVWLITARNQHITLDDNASEGIYADVVSINEDSAEIIVRGSIDNQDRKPSELKLNVSISDADGKIKATTGRNIVINGGKSFSFNEKLHINSPKLWHPDHPHLYDVKVTVCNRKDMTIRDMVQIPLGLRWFEVDSDNGFMINGKPLKLIGACRHQDQEPMGIAIPDEVHRRDMRMLKEMGANFVRLAHYPQDDAVLRACDQLGLLVWEEIPVVDIISQNDDFRTNAETALREMIRQHYNHPSIIMWGYMNEAVIQLPHRVKKQQLNGFYESTLSLARHLEETLKKEDPGRLSTMAFHGNQIYNKIGLSNITDICGWNLYQGWYGEDFGAFDKFVDEEHRKYPSRPLFISEFGAGSDSRIQSLEPHIFDFSTQWQQMFLEHYLPAIMKRPFIIGATEWNFIDFSSASRQESMPHVNNKGLLYNDRKPKDVYYYFQAFLRHDIPVMHIAVNDWKERTVVSDGEDVIHPVKVYSNLENVTLSVNGNTIGNRCMENFNAIWDVPLTKGKNRIEATGIYQGKEITETSCVFVDMKPRHIPSESHSKLEIAVNVGGNCFFTDDKSGLCWLPDQAYTEGSWGYVGGDVFRSSSGRIGTTAEIRDTRNTPLMQTKRKEIESYRFDLPNGIYEVELLFADLMAPTGRVAYDIGAKMESTDSDYRGNIFNISVNGERWLDKFSPAMEAGGNRHISKKRRFTVTDKKLTVDFIPIKGITFLNAVKITGIL